MGASASTTNSLYVYLLFRYCVTSVELTDISKPTVTPHQRSKSVGTESSITFLSEYRYCADSAEKAPLTLHDTQGAGQQQQEDVKIMNLGEDWIDWTGKLDTTVPISSALDRAVTFKWDALDAYDPWAGAEDESMVIEDLTLPQDHDFLSAHTDNNPSSSSLSFEEEARFLRIAMPGPPPTFLSCLDPALRTPKGEGPNPPISPPPSVSSSSTPRTYNHKRKQPPASRPRTHQSKGHNATERKYRNNINSKLNILRLCVPSLCAASCTATVPSEKSSPGVDDYDDNNSDNCCDGDGDGGGGGGGGAEQRCTKATIITKATAYILAQERDSKRLRADIMRYRRQIAAFEALGQAGVLWPSSSAAWQRSVVGDV